MYYKLTVFNTNGKVLRDQTFKTLKDALPEYEKAKSESGNVELMRIIKFYNKKEDKEAEALPKVA